MRLTLISLVLVVVATTPSIAQLPPVFALLEGQIPREVTGPTILADLDGDGDADLFAPLSGVFLNDGHGRFTPNPAGTSPAGSGSYGISLEVADLDGDGRPEMLLTNAGTVVLWVGSASGAFTPAPQLPSLGIGTVLAVRALDFDGDGDLDLFALTVPPGQTSCFLASFGGTGCSGPPRLLRNDGALVFTDVSATLPPGLLLAAPDCVPADFDADGDADVFVAQGGVPGTAPAAERFVLRNDPGSAWTVVPMAGGTGGYPALLRSGDVDGDGRGDVVVVTNVLIPQLVQVEELFLGGAGGSFVLAASGGIPIGVQAYPPTCALAEVDGLPGVERLRVRNGAIEIASFTGAGFGAPINVLPEPTAIQLSFSAADIDGDGDTDIVAGRRIRFHGPGVSFVPEPRLYPDGVTRIDGTADFDADGDLDLLAGAGSLTWVLDNDGAGFFGAQTVSAVPVFRPAAADADGDGDLDLGAPDAGGNFRVFLNGGAAGWSAGATLAAPGYITIVAGADFTGDGVTDWCAGSYSPGPNAGLPGYLIPGTGGGALGIPAVIDPVPAQTKDVVIADFDGDGDQDIVQANAALFFLAVNGTSAPCRLLRNNGNGTFLAANLSVPAARCVAAGDVDGDQDLDLALGGRILLNQGGGVFATGQVISTLDSEACAFLDEDEDGDLDLLLHTYPVTTALHRNDGTGAFALRQILAITTFGMPPGPDFHVGDHDRDGDPDVFTNDEVVTNLSRHVHVAGVPRPGRPFTLSLFGDASGSFALWVSPARADIPAPPFGRIFLDLAPAVSVLPGSFGADGRASATFAVPADPGLVNLALHWQAALPGQGRVSNLAITRAEGF